MTRRSNGRLEEAMTLLIHNEAALLSRQAAADERFLRIESDLAEIKAILLRHERILLRHERTLQALPEVIREKIGFRTPPPRAPR